MNDFLVVKKCNEYKYHHEYATSLYLVQARNVFIINT